MSDLNQVSNGGYGGGRSFEEKINFGTDAKQLGYNGFQITQISDGRDLKY